MQTQKMLMWFTLGAGFIYGLLFIMFPRTFLTMMQYSPELMNDLALANMMHGGVTLLVVVFVAWNLMMMTDAANCARVMTVFSAVWAIFGIGDIVVYGTYFSLSLTSPIVFQSLLFLVIAVIHYAFRTPK